jgi:hypothetical protein
VRPKHHRNSRRSPDRTGQDGQDGQDQLPWAWGKQGQVVQQTDRPTVNLADNVGTEIKARRSKANRAASRAEVSSQPSRPLALQASPGRIVASGRDILPPLFSQYLQWPPFNLVSSSSSSSSSCNPQGAVGWAGQAKQSTPDHVCIRNRRSLARSRPLIFQLSLLGPLLYKLHGSRPVPQ